MAESERVSPVLSSMLVLVVLIAVAVIGVFFLWEKPPQTEEKIPMKQVSLGQVPEDWAVTNLEGKEVLAREWRGKVVFLNLWATWCPPCIAEMPSIQDLYQSLPGSDVVFVILSEQEIGKVKPFVTNKKWDLPFHVAAEGLPPVLQTKGIPATFIINSRGEVIFRHIGGVNWNTPTVKAFLKKVS